MFITKAIKEILDQARKFGLHLTLAQQQVGTGMTSEIKDSVLGNPKVTFVGRNNPRSLKAIAEKAQVKWEDFGELEGGRFFMHVGEKGGSPVQVFDHLVGKRNAMSDAEWERVKAQQLKRYYRPIDDDYGDGEPEPEPDIYRPRF